VRANAINHHDYESAIIHVQPIASSNKLVRSIPRERAVGVSAKIGFVKAGHGGDRYQQVLSALRGIIWHRIRDITPRKA
jgi:hypothetical protein